MKSKSKRKSGVFQKGKRQSGGTPHSRHATPGRSIRFGQILRTAIGQLLPFDISPQRFHGVQAFPRGSDPVRSRGAFPLGANDAAAVSTPSFFYSCGRATRPTPARPSDRAILGGDRSGSSSDFPSCSCLREFEKTGGCDARPSDTRGPHRSTSWTN